MPPDSCNKVVVQQTTGMVGLVQPGSELPPGFRNPTRNEMNARYPAGEYFISGDERSEYVECTVPRTPAKYTSNFFKFVYLLSETASDALRTFFQGPRKFSNFSL